MDDVFTILMAVALIVLSCVCILLGGALDDRKNDCMNGAPIVYNKTVYHCVKG